MTMTRETARAAAMDAGNRNMRENGRTKWNEDDWNVAAREFNRLWSEAKERRRRHEPY